MPLIPPTKINLGGNKGASQGFIKFARAQLAILERQMSYQNLNEGRRVVTPFNGVEVECISKFGRKEVRIYVAPRYPVMRAPSYKEEPQFVPEEEVEVLWCFSSPCFVSGIILDILTPPVADDDKTYYSIALCDGEEYLKVPITLFISTAGWEEYEVGQTVLVTANHGPDIITVDCCGEGFNLKDQPGGILITAFSLLEDIV